MNGSNNQTFTQPQQTTKLPMFVAAVTVKHTDLTTKDHNPQEGIPVSCSVALAGGGGTACSKNEAHCLIDDGALALPARDLRRCSKL